MSDLVVSEIFGPTFQGEGPSAGRVAMFVRLGRCNLHCSWCDTAYTWDWERFDPVVELRDVGIGDVLARLDAIAAPLLVVTGGEPLLQRRPLAELVSAAHARRWRVEVETNGTLPPGGDLATLVDQWNVSLKLANSGVGAAARWRPEAVRALVATGRAVAKFVVSDVGDLVEVAGIVEEAGLRDVWVMPEARDAAGLARQLAALGPAVLEHGWNLSSRLQLLVWGDTRGM